MAKVIIFILGVFLSAIGLSFMILYLNLLTIGYSFLDFVKFINSRFECLLLYIGIILIVISFERWIRNELLLRHTNKLK